MDRPHRGRSPWRWRAALLLAVGPFLVGSAPAQGDLAAAPGDGAADYRIGVEDVLRVYVLEDELLKAGTLLIVRPDGKIGFPYVKGNIRAAGRTTEELEEEIAEKLTPYIREPTVTVIVAEVNSFRVYVLGEVNEPGVIQVRRRLRVLQILALARDVTEFAEKGKIQLVRMVNGREVRFRLDYRKILAGDPDHNLWVRPEDVLVVP